MGVVQVGNEGDLRRLVFQIATQVGAPKTASQGLLGGRKELFENVVGACHNCHYAPAVIDEQLTLRVTFGLAG